MICVPITASKVREAIKDIREASKIADLIELRLDLIKDVNENKLEKLLGSKKKKIIVTDRKKRLRLIEKAIELKAGFVDLDISMGEKTIKKIIKNKKNTKAIVSFHNFKETNKKEISNELKKIEKLKPDIIKIATFAECVNDNIIIFDLIRKNKDKKIIAMCMGEKGEPSRVLAPLFGSFLTFGSLKKGKESAPGQIEAKVLRDVYRIDKLKGKKVKIFGLVGNPVKYSKGFLVHNRAFEKLKLDGVYVNFLTDHLGNFIKNYSNLVSGLSVTIPFKREIIKYVDKTDPTAKDIGAVNTVVNAKGKLIGYNTDCIGAVKAIKEKTDIKNRKAVIIGAGGAARAIAYGIKEEKGKLIILNRTISKAEKLAKELGCEYGSLDKLGGIKNINILINATSIGMRPSVNESPVKNNKLLKEMVVFDTVYNPAMTKLLKDAKANGCKVINGVEMFINQAAAQFELFTGRKAPIGVMRAIMRETL